VDLVHNKPVDLPSRLKKPLYIPETLTVTEVLRSFKQHRQTMALIVNEYGEFQGLVTLHDVLEALVGQMPPDEGAEDPAIVRREDGSLLIDGAVNVERFKDALGIEEELPPEDSGSYNTLAGFVMFQLGRVPQVADHFEWGGMRFEVIDMDGRRIDKVLVSRVTSAPHQRTASA
jgi:putative hemolysin